MKFNISSDSQTAFRYLYWLVGRLDWFKENGYPSDIIPKGDLLEEMKKAIANEMPKDEFKNQFETPVAEQYYDAPFFKQVHQAIETQIPVIAKTCDSFDIMQQNWGFKLLDAYAIDLTYGGPGGSYNPKGTVMIRLPIPTSPEFLDRPFARTITHEILHIGIEENIVSVFSLTQNEKERVVDLMCRHFMDDYPMQKRGDTCMDAYVTTQAIINNLPAAIAQKQR